MSSPRPRAEWISLCAALALAAACGPPPSQTPPDAGPDKSCGLDCAAQGRYGLIVNRCFEYSKSLSAANPAELGVLVKPVETLEGGVEVLPLEYRESGQILMTDFLAIKGGDLYVARRSFLPGESVTYRGEGDAIVGVRWLESASAAGESFTTSAQADLVGVGDRRTEATTLRVVLTAASTSELNVPEKAYADGVKLLSTETPEHGGADSTRVWVPEVGFILFRSTFRPVSGAVAQEYRLQRIRDLGTPDAGTAECSLGSP